MIGYFIAQALQNNLPSKYIANILTQTLVDKNDPAFENPTKFVGPVYTREEADKLAKEKGWTVKQDGDYVRRVVPSPMPQSIVEETVIEGLLKMKDVVVVCTGGGGVPVMRDEKTKQLTGLEAVIDKDRASNVLAQAINADVFIMLTDVSSVETDFHQPDSKKIKTVTPKQIDEYAFAQGSMGPKVESAAAFVSAGGKFSAIGSLTDLVKILAGEAGTRIVPDCPEPVFY